MKKYMIMLLSLGLVVCLCSCGSGSQQQSGNDSSADTETVEDATESATVEEKNYPDTLPEDNGNMTGVYKWVEMADNDATAIEEAQSEKVAVAYYSLDGRRLAQPESGRVCIVRMSDGTARKVKF